MIPIVAYALAQSTNNPAGQGSDPLGAVALEVIAALLVAGIAQYVGWRAFNDQWKAVLVSAPCAVGTFSMLADIFNN